IQFNQALELDPSRDFNPQTKANQINQALPMLQQGAKFADSGKIPQAIQAYKKAQELDPTLEIYAPSWNYLCWNAAIYNQVTAEVLDACDQAVKLQPEDAEIHNNRGVARALTGDFIGAIEDFQMYVDVTVNEQEKSLRQNWIDSLNIGQNPFTENLLQQIRESQQSPWLITPTDSKQNSTSKPQE
ncbi:MAG: tetratricopeptide repeat protein, partial [Cyanobacteria bacterium J06592_8]